MRAAADTKLLKGVAQIVLDGLGAQPECRRNFHVGLALGGWESPEMVRRYAHLAADHLAPYAPRLGAVRAVGAENDGNELGVAISQNRVGIGAVEWIRTTDLLITNQLLYQLSYNSPE